MNELPIEHLSYSAISTFLSNPYKFKKTYILKVYDDQTSPSAIVGKAFHKVAELFFSGMELNLAMEKGFQLIEEQKDENINYGKTGSREQILKDFTSVVEMFFAEFDAKILGKVLDTEKKILTNFSYEDQEFPVPMKAVVDLVSEKGNELYIWDFKTTSKFSEVEKENPAFILQSICNYFAVKEEYKRTPKKMIFIEIKTSKNKDGSSQIQFYEIDFAKSIQYFAFFTKIYVSIIRALLNPDFEFLPNFRDMISGQESWEDFSLGVMDFEMPTQVEHQSPIKRNIEKEVIYRESVASNKINENLPDKDKIIAKMREFGVPLSFSETFEGKNITLHTFFVSRAVKMNTILQFEKDLMLALKTKSIRILAPIAGTEKIGIELPNKVQNFESAENYFSESSDCKFPVGLNVFNDPIYFDFSTSATPHLLIAGATGGGKSVFLNVLIRALLKKNEFDLILVDPKETEFAEFKRESKVLHYSTEIAMADSALKFLVDEMRSRFKKLSDLGFKDISELQKSGATMRRIAVIIDEVADLFLDDEFTEVEKNITRLAQKSRAVGIHLILATQRPSVDVITGKLKANFTSRIAFMTATKVDSKVILDQNGAEQLIGNGDLLFMTPTEKEPLRLQSFY